MRAREDLDLHVFRPDLTENVREFGVLRYAEMGRRVEQFREEPRAVEAGAIRDML